MWRWMAHTKFSVGKIQAVLLLVVLMEAHRALLPTRSGSMSTNRFCVGGILRASFSYGFTGNIKEIIISSPNSDSDRQKIEGYLAHKLSIVSNLVSSHPTTWVRPLHPAVHLHLLLILHLAQERRSIWWMVMWKYPPVRQRIFLMVAVVSPFLPG